MGRAARAWRNMRDWYLDDAPYISIINTLGLARQEMLINKAFPSLARSTVLESIESEENRRLFQRWVHGRECSVRDG